MTRRRWGMAAVVMCAGSLAVSGMRAAAPETAPAGKPAQPPVTYAPEITKLDFKAPGRVALLKNGKFGPVAAGTYQVSEDEGKTWKPVAKLYEGEGLGVPVSGMLTEATDGSLVLIYRDEKGMVFDRYKEGDRHRVKPGAQYPIWSIRSTDGGETWTDRQKIFPGFCGALIDVLATKDGRIVVPITNLLYEPERHGTSVYSSGDGGKTWHEARVIDIGGFGVEDGAMEASLAERNDGSILMYMRTTRDFLWESVSTDGGKTWSQARPTKINSSNSPPYLLELASGRHALSWNHVHGEDNPNITRRVGYAEKPESVFREELSFAISSDGGATWTKPTVVARQPGQRLAYRTCSSAGPAKSGYASAGNGCGLMRRRSWAARQKANRASTRSADRLATDRTRGRRIRA